MQRTLKREFKELEIVKRETIEVSYSTAVGEIQLAPHGYREASVRRVSEPGVRCVFRLSCAERVHFSSALSEPASVSLFVSPPLLVGGAVERAAKSQRGSKYPLSAKGMGTPARICAVRETEALKRAPSRVSVPGPTSGIAGERKGELGFGDVVRFGGSNLRDVRRLSGPPVLVSSPFLGCLGSGFSRLRARDAGALKRAGIITKVLSMFKTIGG
jgi:hypothetical protein